MNILHASKHWSVRLNLLFKKDLCFSFGGLCLHALLISGFLLVSLCSRCSPPFRQNYEYRDDHVWRQCNAFQKVLQGSLHWEI